MNQSDKININNELPSWWKNPIWNYSKGFFKNKIILIGILIFIGYWGLPLIMSFYYSTLYPNKMSGSTGHIPLAYLSDYTHLIFGITISFAGTLCIYTLIKIPQTIDSLINENVLKETVEDIHKLYLKNRKLANSLITKIISFIFMVAVSRINIFKNSTSYQNMIIGGVIFIMAI